MVGSPALIPLDCRSCRKEEEILVTKKQSTDRSDYAGKKTRYYDQLIREPDFFGSAKWQ